MNMRKYVKLVGLLLLSFSIVFISNHGKVEAKTTNDLDNEINELNKKGNDVNKKKKDVSDESSSVKKEKSKNKKEQTSVEEQLAEINTELEETKSNILAKEEVIEQTVQEINDLDSEIKHQV